MFYSKPPSYDIPIESIVPEGWGDEFNDEKPEEEEYVPTNVIKSMNRKETCMVEIWKDEKRDRTIGVIDICITLMRRTPKSIMCG